MTDWTKNEIGWEILDVEPGIQLVIKPSSSGLFDAWIFDLSRGLSPAHWHGLPDVEMAKNWLFSRYEQWKDSSIRRRYP